MGKVGMGIIGVGGISESHIYDIQVSSDAELVAICDINEETLQLKGNLYNIPNSHRFINYVDLLKCNDVDAVSICTPNDVHYPITVDTIKFKKPYVLEKPITLNYDQAKTLRDMTRKINLPNMVDFSYRFKSAVRYARWLILNDYLGEIHHVYSQYIQGWANNEETPLIWRFVKKFAGTGSLGDLGSHMLDLTRFLTGQNITKVCAQAGIFINRRKKLNSEEVGDVDVDDYCDFMAELEGGISSLYTITRYGYGRGNYQRVEVYGSKGGLVYTLDEDGQGIAKLEICIGNIYGESRDYHEINIPKEFISDRMQSFFDIINEKGDGLAATIEDGCINQLLLDSIAESFEQEKWVYLKDKK